MDVEDDPNISISIFTFGVGLETAEVKISTLEISTFGAEGLARGVDVGPEKISISEKSIFGGCFEGVEVAGEEKLSSRTLVVCTGLG